MTVLSEHPSLTGHGRLGYSKRGRVDPDRPVETEPEWTHKPLPAPGRQLARGPRGMGHGPWASCVGHRMDESGFAGPPPRSRVLARLSEVTEQSRQNLHTYLHIHRSNISKSLILNDLQLDIQDSKSGGRNPVRVRVPPSVLSDAPLETGSRISFPRHERRHGLGRSVAAFSVPGRRLDSASPVAGTTVRRSRSGSLYERRGCQPT